MQAPLSRAEREQARLVEARNRWECSKEVEKQVVAKRETEKAAVAKQRQEGKDEQRQGAYTQHRRSLNADKLSKLPGMNKRLSKRQLMMKAEDWRRFQQDVGPEPTYSRSRRDSAVPFPVAQTSPDQLA